jgi:pSer/pThr/pTyr-binding forkhead associated (FHA) protein
MLGPSGRITLASLNWYFKESGRDDFIAFVKNPVLMGSALSQECLASAEQVEENQNGDSCTENVSKTFLINADDQISKKSGPGSSLPYAIYPLVKRSESTSPDNCITIGRTKDCDMNMKDLAVSKMHAKVTISKGNFYIQDCGSTNGTRVGGRKIDQTPVMLNDQDIVTFGDVKFTFLTPASLYSLLRKG